jgi:hypothetical protein
MAAAAIDSLLGLGTALLLSGTPIGRFFAERAVVMLQIDNPASVWKGTLPLILGAFGEVVYTVPFAVLLIVGTEAVFDRSPGKWLSGLRIVGAEHHATPRQLCGRAAIKLVGAWGCVVGLLTGYWPAAAVGLIFGMVVVASILSSRPLHDAWTGVRLVNSRLGQLKNPPPLL